MKTMNDSDQSYRNNVSVYSEEYEIAGNVIVKHKSYYLVFDINGKHYEEEIIAIGPEATRVVDVLAEWKLEECLAILEMEKVYAGICSKKTKKLEQTDAEKKDS